MNWKKLTGVAFLFTVFIALSASKPKDLKDVVLNDLIEETKHQLNSPDGGVKLVWWLPTEFWATVYSQSESVSQETSDEIIEALQSYTMVIVIDGEINSLGSFKSKSPEEMRNNIVLKNASGSSFKPLATEDISYEAKVMLNVLNPMFSNLLGKLGENMEVLMFSNDGQQVLDPFSSKGGITYEKTEIDLGLPLSSLLQNKICPEDNEEMNPKWNYCPHHGTKL